MRTTGPLLVCILLVGGVVGCRATPPPAPETDTARIRELEARVAWLEAQTKAATFVEDEILALEVERASYAVTYAPDHPAMLDIDRKIEALKKVHALDQQARRDAMCHRLEAERETLLGTYTPEHPSIRKLDAKIAFLKAG